MAKRPGPWFETPRCCAAPHHEDHREARPDDRLRARRCAAPRNDGLEHAHGSYLRPHPEERREAARLEGWPSAPHHGSRRRAVARLLTMRSVVRVLAVVAVTLAFPAPAQSPQPVD